VGTKYNTKLTFQTTGQTKYRPTTTDSIPSTSGADYSDRYYTFLEILSSSVHQCIILITIPHNILKIVGTKYNTNLTFQLWVIQNTDQPLRIPSQVLVEPTSLEFNLYLHKTKVHTLARSVVWSQLLPGAEVAAWAGTVSEKW